MSVRIIGTSQFSEANVYNISGSLYVTAYDVTGNADGGGNTYDVSCTAFTPGATPQDVFTITNTGAKSIYVTRFRFSSIQTTAGINSWYLVRRSTPNYAGTFTYQTPVPRNVLTPFSTAIVQTYTANPTNAGILVGNIRTAKVYSPANLTTGSCDQWIWDFDDFQTNPIILRGYGQVLALNLNGVGLPAGISILCSATWIER